MVCETDIKYIYYKTVKEDVSQQIVLDQLLFVSAKYNYLHYCLFIFMIKSNVDDCSLYV